LPSVQRGFEQNDDDNDDNTELNTQTELRQETRRSTESLITSGRSLLGLETKAFTLVF
jgi:hypothetical protein